MKRIILLMRDEHLKPRDRGERLQICTQGIQSIAVLTYGMETGALGRKGITLSTEVACKLLG